MNCVCVCVTNFVDFEGYSSEIKLMIQDCFSLIVNMYLIYNLPILEKKAFSICFHAFHLEVEVIFVNLQNLSQSTFGVKQFSSRVSNDFFLDSIFLSLMRALTH